MGMMIGTTISYASGIARGLGDEDCYHCRDIVFPQQARDAQGVGYPVAYDLGEPGVGEELAESDAGAEEQDGAPVYADGLVPGEGEAALGPVDRQEEEERRGEDRYDPLVQPA